MFFLVQISLSCNQKKQKSEDVIVVRDVIISATEEVSEPAPPPPPSKNDLSRFKSVGEWLSNISKNEIPPKSGLIYRFSFSDIERPGLLSLYAFSGETSKEYIDTSNVLFYPKEMYYMLSEKKYGALTKEEIRNLIRTEIEEFIKSKNFKESFYSEATAIVFDWQVIWERSLVK